MQLKGSPAPRGERRGRTGQGQRARWFRQVHKFRNTSCCFSPWSSPECSQYWTFPCCLPWSQAALQDTNHIGAIFAFSFFLLYWVSPVIGSLCDSYYFTPLFLIFFSPKMLSAQIPANEGPMYLTTVKQFHTNLSYYPLAWTGRMFFFVWMVGWLVWFWFCFFLDALRLLGTRAPEGADFSLAADRWVVLFCWC